MKAEITKLGEIHITAETITEAWALNALGGFDLDTDERVDPKMVFDCSILLVENEKD